MKLYKVPDNSKIIVKGEIDIPPAALPVKKGDILHFYHTDGIYSYCKNEDGDAVYLAAWAEVEIYQPKGE